MRCRLIVLLLSLSWVSCFLGAPALASSLTPEQTAELYYRARLSYDRAAMLRLKREWGSSSDGIRYVDMDLVNDPVAWHLKYRMSGAPPGTTAQQKDLFARLLVAAGRRTQCRATTGRIGAQLPNGTYLARVQLSCTLPEAVSEFRRVTAGASAGEIGARQRLPSPRILKGLIDALANAPMTRRVSTEILLVGDSAKQAWRPGVTEQGFERVGADIAQQMARAGFPQ